MKNEPATHNLEEILNHAAHLLPAQGPIGVFIHHNTLHAFQHLPFEQAVVEASRTFGTEPYLAEAVYREELRRGRIQRDDIEAVLAAESNAPIVPGRLDSHALQRVCLLEEIPEFDAATLDWELEEARLSAEGIRTSFDVCLQRTGGRPYRQAESMRVSANSLHQAIHPLLIRLCGAYLDQGMAYWPMPCREDGFYASVRGLLAPKAVLLPRELAGLDAEFRRQAAAQLDPEQAVLEVLHHLGIAERHWATFLTDELLALPGWAGMFRQLEEKPSLAPHIALRCSLLDYLAVRLTLLRAARQNLPPHTSAASRSHHTQQARVEAAHLAVVASRLGLNASALGSLPDDTFATLAREAAQFDSLARRRLFHLAYERRHERQILMPLAAFQTQRPPRRREKPAGQVFFCIDDREESIRRHLEEVDPGMETFGAAGFFGVAIDYAGIDDAAPVSLCPIVVTPQHAVREKPVEGHAEVHGKRKAIRRLLALLLHNSRIGSRSMVRGWLATATLGLFSLFPLVTRILSPRGYAWLRQKVNNVLVPRVETELTLTRHGQETVDGLAHGFSIQEKTDRVAGVLLGAGLQANFARIVVVLGHGSTSINNPHESAYDCGACGGRRGGPNARLFAAMANHPEVRAALLQRGIAIPDDTCFIGGYHDTCSDQVEMFDLHHVPATHTEDLARIRRSLDAARMRNAQERGRRFEFCRADSPQAALRHAEERSEHLAEPRPEYGHSTNAVCVVGRRDLTRGLFLDRRAFLVSYNAATDPTDEFLARQLGAVVPVCAGISLEYYFSRVDNERYGCGTKLPHNVAGLLGVMNGHASDLRTGLTWQMVEIHEPVRILFVIETTPQRLSSMLRANPLVREFVENRWIRVATIDPDNAQIHVYREGTFEPLANEPQDLPVASSSTGWYRGRMEHLPVARIGSLQEVA